MLVHPIHEDAPIAAGLVEAAEALALGRAHVTFRT
jgi:hypothetical protein